MDPHGAVTEDGKRLLTMPTCPTWRLSDIDTTINTTEIILKARYAFDDDR